MDATFERRACFPARFMVYCSERFPLPSYGMLVALFSLAGLSLSQMLRGQVHFNFVAYTTAFLVTFILFFQLRVADEFKDHVDDCLWTPQRPVPRGLVSLRELAFTALGGALIQILLCSFFKPVLLIYLALVWIYFSLMSREFFVGEYLRNRPIIYMLSHMFILVLSDLFITAVDFAPGPPPHALVFFFAASFAAGMVIEVGRKIKTPWQEREGITTYSKVLGLVPASILLFASILVAQISVCLALHSSSPIAGFLPADILVALMLLRFCKQAHLEKGKGKLIETLSSAMTALSYIAVITVCFRQ